MEKPYRILLYYNFIPVPYPEAERQAQEEFCRQHGLLGRILVAPEGINGTVSGIEADIQAYMDWMAVHPVFSGTEFKVDVHGGHAFHKLHVRVKPEIVHFGVNGLQPWEKAGAYVSPQAFKEMLEQGDENLVILDARSNYETRIGKFRGATSLDIENFRELPEHLHELESFRDKTVVTYCTGGIKCEKVTAWLLQQGFRDVRQLHGGIIRYAHETGGAHFEGDCYVFDERVVVPVNAVNPITLGSCLVCGNPSSRSMNCANAACNDQIVMCDTCADKMQGCCSQACFSSPRRRAWDGTGQYLRGVNSKNYIDHTP